eukprot:6181949-Pleurochrysis_carterae.AAC.1
MRRDGKYLPAGSSQPTSARVRGRGSIACCKEGKQPAQIDAWAKLFAALLPLTKNYCTSHPIEENRNSSMPRTD